jgi:serine protease Do
LPEDLFARGSRARPDERGQPSADALDGVEVMDIDARRRRQSEMPANIQGALVTKVDQDSNAAEAGLRPGDVIVEINRKPVRGADDAVAFSEKAKDGQILLRVWRNDGGGRGGMTYLTVDNSKQK